MSPQAQKDRWSEVKEILAAALDLPPDERNAFLDGACNDLELRAEVESLLGSSDDAAGFIEQPAIAQGVELIDQQDTAALTGSRIGPYRVVSLIGEGGVGAVYKAVRDNDESEQYLALKLLKRGLDSEAVLRRFREERRILARLNHPNIARMFDGGLAPDGRPYFVMEFLEGVPLATYCREFRDSLTLRQRLELLLPVCDAVEYSHRNLVVHRDLKAANILVTSAGVPKLLDFGIAKVLDSDTTGERDATLVGERLLTPDYASPEQIAGDAITTAADIYSLGVVLYEVLTGVRPRQFAGLSHAEMLRAIMDSEPLKPSTVAAERDRGAIAGDLDTIVLKAMHRAPERRYSSAALLAEDIRRFLDGRPVRARPDTAGYRLNKFIGRNRVAVAAVSVAVFAVIGGAFAAVYQGAVAASREREARKRFVEMRELAGGLLGELDAALEDLPGATAARAVLTRKVLHYLDGLAREEVSDVSLQRDLASAYERLGDILGGAKASNLGESMAALNSYRKSLAIRERISAGSREDPELLRDRARTHSRISDVLAITGDHAQGLEQEQRSLDLRLRWQQMAPEEPAAIRAVASSYQELAGDLDRLGRFDEALANRRRVLALLQESVAADGSTTARLAVALAHKRLGRSLRRAGAWDEAAPHFQRAISIERTELQRNPSSAGVRSALGFSLSDLGMLYTQTGRFGEALVPLTEALEMRIKNAAADPKDWRAANLHAAAFLHHGRALVGHGQRSAGIAELRTCLSMRQELASRNPQNAGARAEIAEAAAALADVLAGTPGGRREAIRLYTEALEIYTYQRDSSSLTAELAGEPERIRKALAALGSPEAVPSR